MKRAAVALLLVALLAGHARADDPPPGQQALLVLRILAYDRELKRRTGGDRVVIAVAHRAGDKASEDAGLKIARAVEDAAENTTVLGMPVGVVSLAADATLEDRLRAAHAAALYLAPGLEETAAQITQITRRRQILSVVPRFEPVRAGVAVGFALRSSRTALIVNLPAARAEGVDFEAAFLRVAEVIKE